MSRAPPNMADMPMPMPPVSPPMTPSYMNMDMGMHMSFFWGKDVIILFQGWPNDHLGMYILALIFVFFLSFAVELLSIIIDPSSSSFISKSKSPLVSGLIYGVGYAIKMALAYMVMLSVMSFNVGVFIVAVIGHAAGGFLVKYLSLTNQQGVATEPLLPLSKPLHEV